MIPKIIHYCWFGGNPLDDLAKKCIESWKKYCPDYEIREWNEANFDINCCAYVKEAYENKKWAFVSDYARLHALYECGGIYMDTDVELLKPIDEFLKHNAFSGFESTQYIPTAIMGSVPKGEWIEYLLSYYFDKHFIKPDGNFDITTNVQIITRMTKEKYNIRLDNTFQEIENILTLYPKEYFCPKGTFTKETDFTDKTVCIHHFNGSWFDEWEKYMRSKLRNFIYKYGIDEGKKRYSKWCKRNKLFIYIKKYGFLETCFKILRKIYRKGLNYFTLFKISFCNNYRLKVGAKELIKYKNKHKGQRCFIVGNGPSLTVEDLEKIKGEVSFAANRIYNIYDKTDWRPTYYSIQDYVVICKSFNEIDKLIKTKKFVGIIPTMYHKKMKNIVFYKLIDEPFYPEPPNFSEDVSNGIYDGWTITYTNIQMAVYMGFSEIYLMGVDHSYSVVKDSDGNLIYNNVKDHFNADDKSHDIPQTFKTTVSYISAKEYAKKNGIKIYNATRGGKLEVFERIDFDSLFRKEK